MYTGVVNTENLTKHYGKVHAVDGISLNVNRGEIYGFLGLNGAGKTTTIRMLLGMINPTSGVSYLFGNKVNAGRTDIWNEVGYLVEAPYSYPDLTVYENLEIIRRLRFINKKGAVDGVIQKLKLEPYKDRKAKNLSLGNAQRLGLAKAIMHNPKILILDEPANGLDPAGIVEIRELLSNMAENHGVTIFISSHILDEISKFATRIGIIHDGILVQESDFNELDKMRYRSLHVNAKNTKGAAQLLSDNGYSIKMVEQGFLEVTGKNAVNEPDLVASLMVSEGFPPTLIKVDEEDLESYFLRTIKNGGIK